MLFFFYVSHKCTLPKKEIRWVNVLFIDTCSRVLSICIFAEEGVVRSWVGVIPLCFIAVTLHDTLMHVSTIPSYFITDSYWVLLGVEPLSGYMTEKCYLYSLYSRPGCHVVSKDFLISKNVVPVVILLLMFRVTWSVSLMHWIVML